MIFPLARKWQILKVTLAFGVAVSLRGCQEMDHHDSVASQQLSLVEHGTVPVQRLHKISNNPVLLCISYLVLLKSQLCFEGQQLWLAGTYRQPIP